jgi:hypothetical protein
MAKRALKVFRSGNNDPSFHLCVQDCYANQPLVEVQQNCFFLLPWLRATSCFDPAFSGNEPLLI